MEIEVPERAKHIRLILTEMARISSHFVFNGAYALEVGALTPIFLCDGRQGKSFRFDRVSNWRTFSSKL